MSSGTSSIYVVTKSHLRWCCEVVLPEVTSPGPDRKGRHRNSLGSNMTGTRFCTCPGSAFQCFFLTIVVVQNVPLRMTGSIMATECDVIKRHVTLFGIHLEVRAHTQPQIVHYRPSCAFSPEVTSSHPWKGGIRACSTGSC